MVSSSSQHFAWVHETSGIQCVFELPHSLHAHSAHFLLQQLSLAQPDAMLSRACPMECQGTPRRPNGILSNPFSAASALPNTHPSLTRPLPAQIFCKGLDPALLFHIIWVDQYDAVKIAITHVPNNGSWGPREQSCHL